MRNYGTFPSAQVLARIQTHDFQLGSPHSPQVGVFPPHGTCISMESPMVSDARWTFDNGNSYGLMASV